MEFELKNNNKPKQACKRFSHHNETTTKINVKKYRVAQKASPDFFLAVIICSFMNEKRWLCLWIRVFFYVLHFFPSKS